jgi:hypothetical protein
MPLDAIRWYGLERRIGYRSINIESDRVDLSISSCHFLSGQNIAPFVKRSSVLQDSNLAENGPFSQNKEELRRSVWSSRYNMIRNMTLILACNSHLIYGK